MKIKTQHPKLISENYRIKIFSIGAHFENHGKALPMNIDDYIARHLAIRLSQEINCDYLGHFPYCGDREGKKARDWNPGVMGKKVVINGIISDIKIELSKRSKLNLPTPSCIILVSGHGGNNYLADEQEKISHDTKIPFLYLPPFSKISIKHKKFGRLEMTHADHAEHSVADYLGLLDKKNLQKINNLAQKDPIKALKEDPSIMGLGGYVLPELGGEKYQSLRDRHPELVKMARNFIMRDKKIIVDKKAGELLIETAIKNAKKTINSFLKTNDLN
jgi:creatinine amidohydrolase/Fe(II)-dependent formamide hydrolase-like protein